MSHPARGAWIETHFALEAHHLLGGRTPRGVRGLKRLLTLFYCFALLSHPARGAWIETLPVRASADPPVRRTPRGVRGLKPFCFYSPPSASRSRTPRGVRGLKPLVHHSPPVSQRSHPARGAWIETPAVRVMETTAGVAPRAGCVD